MNTDPLLFLRVFLRTRKNGIWLPRSFNHYQEKYLKSCLKSTEVRPKPARQCGASFLCVAEAIWRAVRRGEHIYLELPNVNAMMLTQLLISELIDSNKLMSSMLREHRIIQESRSCIYVFWTGGRIEVGTIVRKYRALTIGTLFDAYICDDTMGAHPFPSGAAPKRFAGFYPGYNSNEFDRRIWLTFNEYEPTVTDRLFDGLFNEFERALAQDENYRKAIWAADCLNVRRCV